MTMRFFQKKSKFITPPKYIIAGLGNPGRKYEITRHNAGFICIDMLAKEENASIDRLKFKALTTSIEINGERCLLMKPQTYMNNSGEAIREAASFYKIAPDNILIIFDDISLPPGKLRVRRKGSDGGHNGIKSVIYHLNSNEFPRIKLGVGEKPHPDYDLAAWALSKFGNDEVPLMKEAFIKGAQAARMIVKGEIDAAMNLFN